MIKVRYMVQRLFWPATRVRCRDVVDGGVHHPAEHVVVYPEAPLQRLAMEQLGDALKRQGPSGGRNLVRVETRLHERLDQRVLCRVLVARVICRPATPPNVLGVVGAVVVGRLAEAAAHCVGEHGGHGRSLRVIENVGDEAPARSVAVGCDAAHDLPAKDRATA